jgi:hypothetical protein
MTRGDMDIMSSATRKRHTIEELKRIVKPVAEKYGVEKIYLFGSVARGNDKWDSDYDFCIEKGKIRGLIKLSGFFQDLRDAVGYEIDLVTTRSLEPEFLNTVMTEGVVVYGQ